MFDEKNEEIQGLTCEYVKELTQIWRRIFDAGMCMENLNKLVEHARIFYKDLVDESLEKESFIQNEIAELKQEADTLRRLLKVDVQLPCIDNSAPLIIVQSDMDKSLANLREQLRERREQICDLLLEQEELCDELGEPPRPLLADPLPTAEEMQEFCNHLTQLKKERLERMSKLATMRREIKHHLEILELKVNTEAENRLLNQRQMKLDKETFTLLQQMHDRYGAQVRQVKESIDNMRKQLETLWTRLQVSPTKCEKLKRCTEYNQQTFDLYYFELQRCEALKSQNIKQYLQQMRAEIVQLWDKTLKSDLQRSRFSHLNNNCYTDDLVVLHELELEDLKAYYEKNRRIYDLYADRQVLWDRMNALEAKSNDPARYNNRGGQLLREEKERKTIATKLPKIEQQIVELVKEYQEREHEPFQVYGMDILELMACDWERKRKEKEKQCSARKMGQTPQPKSAGGVAGASYMSIRTPMSIKSNTSTASSIRKAASSTNISGVKPLLSAQKRKLNPAEKHTPVAKRSLMHALNSPSVFVKPAAKTSAQKSLKKPTRIIATTIRRKSGRQSGNTNVKKRRSLNKSGKEACKSAASATSSSGKVLTKPIPHVVIDECSFGYIDVENTANDTYDSFQKYIEPASRSSTILTTTIQSKKRRSPRSNRRLQQQRQESSEERMLRLPNPRKPITSKKFNAREFYERVSPVSHSPGGASASSHSQKKTNKILPIII